MLASFDELVLRCTDNDSRSHIKDAIRCYEAGAYRSAIVATYIAVCFDLIAKLRSLAAVDDAEAKARIAELEKLQQRQLQGDPSAIASLLAFERGLPVLFRDKFEFFGTIEYDDIARLITDRNRCAHPTFLLSEEPYHPSAEVARLHLRSAIDLVLSQEPKQGKAALRSLEAMINSKYFPEKRSEIQIKLESSPLKSARSSLINSFIDEVVFGISTRGSPYHLKFSAASAVEVFVDMAPSIAGPRYCKNVSKLLQSSEDLAVAVGAILALRSPHIADALDDGCRPPLRQFVKKPELAAKLSTIHRALQINCTRDVAEQEVGKLTSADYEVYGSLTKIHKKPHKSLVKRAIELLIEEDDDLENTHGVRLIIQDADASCLNDSINDVFSIRDSGDFSHKFISILQCLDGKGSLDREALQEISRKYHIEDIEWIEVGEF